MTVCWYCPDSIFKDFKDPLDNPNFRLRCWYNHRCLLKDGHDSRIINSTKDMIDPDVLILMSFGEAEYAITRWMNDKQKIVLHDYTENIRDIPILEATKQLCTNIVCCSAELAKIESETYKDKVVVIKDPVEEFPYTKNYDYTPEQLSVVWCGMGGNAELPEVFIKPIVESLGMRYIEISNRAEATIKWDRQRWAGDMLHGDIAICPQAHWDFPTKSNVKVTTAMSLGLPALASPLISYKEIIQDNETGFICDTLEDWEICLKKLKDKSLRQYISENAKKRLEPYRIGNIYKSWLQLFK